MKPIPAIDENDEFVEATLRGGAKRAIATLNNGCGCIIGVLGYWWNLDGSSPQPDSREWDLIDLPVVRKRVERAKAERARVAREDAKRLEAFGVEDRTDAGVKVTYSPSGAASVDSRELFEKVIEPLLAESQRRQAIRAHAQVDEPRRPSFAEALENAFIDLVTGHPYEITWGRLLAVVADARAASGE